MNVENVITGTTEEEIWSQLNEQFQSDPDPLQYTVLINHANHRIVLNIDIDLGGGFESGYETTSLSTVLPVTHDFRFAIHREHFTDEIGKFFGMEDVELGYEEFDKKLVVKTNNSTRLKEIFADPDVRSVLQQMDDFTFGITAHRESESKEKETYLELLIEEGITDLNKLRPIYRAYCSVLKTLDTKLA